MYHTTEYNREFWNAARAKRRIPNTTVLETGRDTQNGGYRLPYESNKKFEALRQKENLFRRIGTVHSAPKGDYTIWAHDNEPEVTWLTDKDPMFFENVETYDDYQLDGHTLGCATRVSEDFTEDAGFDVETQVTREFARSIGRAEEAACISIGERDLGVVTDFEVVASESGHVLDDDRCHIACIHLCNHALEVGAVE